ncbi:MAG: hypothetical protein HY744_18695 [Deltaproteobacteria bacterium]|nr:hypothetical protein [Deltaproteobacteria bacterium]
MNEELRERVAALIEAGRTEKVGERFFVPIVTLESGTRLGLDEEAGWVSSPPDADALRVFGAGGERHFFEAVESKRSVIEDLLEQGAAEQGLPVEAVVLSFPAVELVAAVLETGSAHFARLGLLWLLPSELRQMRSKIAQLARSPELPQPVRDLAERLIVPESE